MAVTKNGADPIDTRLVRKLADILSETGLTEIEVERADLKIRVKRELTVSATVGAAAPVQAAYPPPAAAAAAAAAAQAPAEEAPRGEQVKSPMVGTVYMAATPGADPFVQVGDKVTQGQTLLIIEAMKTMNPIPAPRAATVLQILVDNEQPVEFGEPLVVIE
ncbi:MAG TPA: acetyl-CoA carboxylase biotin carboxyl carrier protein [Caulobacteraceae bacterium]|jgi:acetyl-CoA carboxylase biotin carboxyl carrier protein